MHVDKLIVPPSDTPRKRPGLIDNLRRLRGREGKGDDGDGERLPCRVLEESGVQTYLKMEGIGQQASDDPRKIHSLLENHIAAKNGPHFVITAPQPLPPKVFSTLTPLPAPPSKPLSFKSLDTIRNVTQQSMLPSQKTIILTPSIPYPYSGVSQSHVQTERMPLPLPHPTHSHIPHAKPNNNNSPGRINMDYGSTVFHSYIPVGMSKMAPCISEREMEYSPAFWREKYEELNGRWQAMRLREVREREVGVGRVALLEEKYEALRESHMKLSEEYKGKLEENQQYYLRMQELQTQLNRLQLASKPDNYDHLLLQLKQKEEQIESLAAKISHLEGEGSFKTAFDQKCLLVGLLKRENESFQAHMQHFQQQYQQEMREMHEQVGLLRGEFDHPEPTRPLKGSSFLKNQQSPLERSLDYTNTRIGDLEAHIAKLNAELTARETVFEEELKQASLTVADLAERLKVTTTERQEAKTQLQLRMGLMESELNKKQSLIRNLRDEVVTLRVNPSLYSSTLTPADLKEDPLKRELQNLRRILFQRQREKLILKQKLQQSQQALQEIQSALERKKLQNQQLRRQTTETQGLQHENTKLLEVIAKKNADMAEMKEMLMEKEQEAGNFQNLTTENDRLRSFMLKKNEELSEMAERLFEQEKKVRELEAAHVREISQFQEQSHHFQEVIARREHEITKVAEQYEELEGNYAELELQLERQRHITAEYESLLKENAVKLEAYQQQLAIRQDQQKQCNLLHQRLEQCESLLNEKEQLQAKSTRQIRDLLAEIAMRQEQLQEMTLQQAQLKQMHFKSSKELVDAESKHDELQFKCSDALSKLKKCKERLCRAEKEIAISRKQLKRHEKCLSVIDEFQERIASLEVTVIKLNMRPALKNQISEPLFEQKVIYHLKDQNQALHEEIRCLKDNNYCQIEQNRDMLKNRLASFRQNLEEAIRQ